MTDKPPAVPASMMASLDAYKGAGTIKHLSAYLGIGVSKLYRLMDADEDFHNRVNAIRDDADDQVVEALFKRAVGCEITETKIVTTADGSVETKTIKEVAPDTNAIAKWLNNRRGREWREPPVVIEDDVAGTITLDNVPKEVLLEYAEAKKKLDTAMTPAPKAKAKDKVEAETKQNEEADEPGPASPEG